MCGRVGEGVGVGVLPHIPHLVKGASCTNVHTEQGEEEEEGREVVSSPSILRGERGGGGGERVVLSPPMSIGQNPADVGGEGLGSFNSPNKNTGGAGATPGKTSKKDSPSSKGMSCTLFFNK